MELIFTVKIFIFILGYKNGEKDSAAIEKKVIIENQPNTRNENISLSDDELRYLIDNANEDEYPQLIYQILDVFRKYRLLYIIINICEMSLFCFLLYLTWNKRESSIAIMEDIYTDMNSKEASVIFYTIFYISLIINIFYYPFGFYSITKKNVKMIKYYSTFTLISSISTILLIYINM